MQVHILYHAKNEAIFGLWILEELQEHGYGISAGTLYPLLHSMEKDGLLSREDRLVEGKIRKYYQITELGEQILEEAKRRARELLKEVDDTI